MTRPTSIRYGLLLLCISGNLLISKAQMLVPREPSPGGSVSQTVGISTISVLYSRPSVKGREIWGKLVPYGWNVQPFGKGNSAPWRAGANENSVLHLSHDAMVEGTPVPAGDYGLFFVINADNSGEVVLSKDNASWGSFFYDPKRDQMRAKIRVRDLNNFTERLTYEFDSVSKNMAELDLNWEKKQFPVKIEFDVDSIFKNYALEVLNGQPGFFWQNNFNAANYALTNKVYIDQGIQWADRAIAQTPLLAPSLTKAGLLDLAGNHAEAEKALQAAMKNATENDLNNYGYQLLGEKKFDKAIAVLKLNTEKHPESANAWDSLGEAYALSGDKKNAIANFKKSLSMNPPAPVKANSEKYLKQLGAM
jgi:tetratricopeptide (TPR) repeat protein